MENLGVLLCLFSFVFIGTQCEEDEGIYQLRLRDSVFGCDNFDNDMVDCSELVLTTQKGDDSDEAKLCGKIKTIAEIPCDYDIEIDIWKLTDMGDEYMYNVRMNFGLSIKDEDTPWYPLLQTLDIKECPVPSKVFEIADLKFSLGSFKDIMTHEFCGNYRIHFYIVDLRDKRSCHTLDISIVEVEE